MKNIFVVGLGFVIFMMVTNTVWAQNDEFQTEQSQLFHTTGYRLDNDDIQADYIYSPLAKTIFEAQKNRRENLPNPLPVEFKVLVDGIHSYIDKMTATKPNLEKQNGLSHAALAEKIVRASFCFGTDPEFVTSQIMTESTFNRRAISRTGAVGFTQMTSIAIDEANDQLGNRGELGAPKEVSESFAQSIQCYESHLGRWTDMWASNQAILPRRLVAGHLVASARAKAWLRASTDRDLIYGQVILKTYLARFRPLGLEGVQLYTQAARAYNGERGQKKVIYADKVLKREQDI
jgi:hypothetical protein